MAHTQENGKAFPELGSEGMFTACSENALCSPPPQDVYDLKTVSLYRLLLQRLTKSAYYPYIITPFLIWDFPLCAMITTD